MHLKPSPPSVGFDDEGECWPRGPTVDPPMAAHGAPYLGGTKLKGQMSAMSRPAPAPASTSAAAAAALAALRESGPLWWRHWDHAAIEQACTCAPLRALADEPELAYWRGLAAFMREDAQALAYLEQAYLGHIAKGDATAATVVAHAALVICQLDSGAMDGGSAWHARVDSSPHTSPPADTLDALSGLLPCNRSETL